jgi:glycosyl transferase family 21
MAISYVVPLSAPVGADLHDLWEYLAGLCELVDDVIVVDNSDARAYAAHERDMPGSARHLRQDGASANGKVANVVTGLHRARHEMVVVADDDVRWSQAGLAAARARFESSDIVRPQNYFRPVVWHACFDTARTLLARLAGGDWPGTLVVRRSVFERAGGEYRGDVLFENLEMVRTLKAAGAREDNAPDLYVARRPPTFAHFRGQQVRQAYDEFARPGRLAASLAVAPAFLVGLDSGRRHLLLLAALLVVGLAGLGRWIHGGRRYFPAAAVGMAPLWLLWRSACSWVALGARLRGGVRYRDTRLRVAATSRGGIAGSGTAASGRPT